jgi:uncharacterized protein YbjT (DUF2867 family)
MRDLKEMGGHVVEYDPKDEHMMKDLFKKASYAMVIPPIHHEHLSKAKCMLKACGEAGVKCVTLMSMLNADKGKGRVMRELHEIEECGKRAGIKHLCIVRKGFMMETMYALSDKIKDGCLPLAVKHGKFAPVSLNDCCHGITKAVMESMKGEDEKEHMKTCNLTGPKLVDGCELAKMASEALDTKIKFEDISMDKMKELLKHHHKLHDMEIQMILEMCEMIREDKFEVKSDTLEKLLNEKPMTPQEFFEHHEKEFKSI